VGGLKVGTQASDIVEGYAALASSVLERWRDLASKAAAKADAGTYDATSAAEDMIAGATLATEAAAEWAAQCYRTVASVTGQGESAETVQSPQFAAPAGSTLALAGPLIKGPGKDQLPVSAITIEPAQLGHGETAFSLRADATGCRGATYVGTVNATTNNGATTPVIVWITVP
jgi:hypothetical protein